MFIVAFMVMTNSANAQETKKKSKKKSNARDVNNRTFYQSYKWRLIVNYIWDRDAGMCQICLRKGKKHFLVRGTKDMTQQGTVDHTPVYPREITVRPLKTKKF